MNRICIGILDLSVAWRSLLDTLGVRYEAIDFKGQLSSSYSCLIINQNPSAYQQQQLDGYVRDSGSVLITNDVAISKFRSAKPVSTLNRKLPPEYRNSVANFDSYSGLIIRWAISPEQEFANTAHSRRRFYFRPMMHPDELVNTVDKNALLVALDRLIAELHFHRTLPYIKKWHSPTEKPAFGFRIDSDFGTKESILKLYTLAQLFKIPFTWFLHVQAHENWLAEFKDFKDQEIALHGYEHGTSDSYEHIYNNIETGYQKMADSGIEPKGFCVPYGIWNDALGDVLKSFEFEYSSEFTLGFDSHPFYPVHKNNLHPTLQIPIHPICTGSLNRKSADETEMFEYFDSVLSDKLKSRHPVFFYHHPMQPGLSVWEKIFTNVRQADLHSITFLDYAQFWKKRNNAIIDATYEAEKRVLTIDSTDNSVFIQLAFNQDKYRLMPASKTNKPLHSVTEYNWEDPDFPTPEKQKELQQGRMQLIKTSLFDWRNRKSL